MAIDKELTITLVMQESFLKSSCPLIKTEDSLLSLASSDIYNDIFYCCVIKIATNSEVNYLCRYFESGAFKTFFTSTAKSILCDKYNINLLLPYAVYTEKDVAMERFRSELKFRDRRKEGNVIFNVFK